LGIRATSKNQLDSKGRFWMLFAGKKVLPGAKIFVATHEPSETDLCDVSNFRWTINIANSELVVLPTITIRLYWLIKNSTYSGIVLSLGTPYLVEISILNRRKHRARRSNRKQQQVF